MADLTPFGRGSIKLYLQIFPTLERWLSSDGNIKVDGDCILLETLLYLGISSERIIFSAHTSGQLQHAAEADVTAVWYNDPIFKSMQFDVIVGNPPYLGGKHMEFLRDSFRLLKDGGELLYLHPSTEFVTLKQGTRR